MAGQQVNGEMPQRASATLDHLVGYPFIHDTIDGVKSHPVGQKSIQMGDTVYRTFAASIMPYLSGPYQHLKPYVEKMDAMGDKTLDKFDEKLPFVKKPTGELFDDGRSIVLFPIHVGMSVGHHVMQTYQDEHRRAGGAGLVTSGTAVINTTRVLTSQFCGTVASFVSGRRAAADERMRNATNNMQNANGKSNANGNNGAAH